jgi:oligopeptide/dipeptide ABC transporter ATP-binding protein
MLRQCAGENMSTQKTDNIVEIKNLKMYFPITRGLLQRKVSDIKAVDDISFIIKRHETLGLVGESGCGKTTTGRCILRLYNPTAGEIFFNGKNIARLPERKIRPLRSGIGSIFQDPYGSLNPRKTAGNIVSVPMLIHHTIPKNELNDRVSETLQMVGLDPGMIDRVPHEFSGGQRQRLGIARALACRPSLIVCDEPISALDVSIQAQIINLLEELQERLGLTYLFIAHDLSIVQHISDRIAVMYLGRIVEIAGSEELYENTLHPYTKALLSAIPIPDPELDKSRHRIILKGEVPNPANPPAGCHFHPRCPEAKQKCEISRPPLIDLGNGHMVACFRTSETL